jgi:hypothetical protein
MNPHLSDLGITLDEVSSWLDRRGVVKIIGYHRGGKSTLAEMLAKGLRQRNAIVIHHKATDWLSSLVRRSCGQDHDVSVDPELTVALEVLDTHSDTIWIIDDAEVLLAYATETLLRSIREGIDARRFSLIFIRNRFVHERSGWFTHRESLLHQGGVRVFSCEAVGV